MRILHVVEATGGGVRRHLQLVLPGLRARGHEVALAYSLRRADPGFSQDLAQFEAAGIVLREIPMRRLPAPADRAAARKVAEFATDFGAEIMHCHGTKAGILGRMQRRIRPVVYSPHAFLFQGATGFKRILLLMLENMFVRQTAALICVSEAEEQVARAADLRFAKVAIARNGVPITSPANPAGFAEFAIGCAARLAPQKGIDVLIRALGQVPGARLTLWGDGPLLAELQALAVAEGVADRVDFAGFAEDAREQVKNMDLGVLPSRFEGLSYQLLEMLEAGLPVVASDVPGNRLPAIDAGLTLVLPDDAVALAAALRHQQALTPAERSACGAQARAGIHEHYSLESQLAALETAYRDVMRMK